jgi:starvation-inducible DNA-binding protein
LSKDRETPRKSTVSLRLNHKERDALETPTDLNPDGVAEISNALRQLLADVFGLYVKTKSFHWHMSGRHFRDYHLLLDEYVTPGEMLAELCADNQQLTRFLRATHEICDRHNDVATASLIENWIDETERRTWFLSETQHDL